MAIKVQPTLKKPNQYDWESWTDGSQWRIKRNVDFTVKSTSMVANLRLVARKLNKQVTVKVCGDVVEFRFF